MDSSLRAELDSLQLRAYGRASDGGLDGDMVQRLQELEAQAREDGRAHTDEPVAAPNPHIPSDGARDSPQAISESAPAEATSPVDVSAHQPVRPSWRRPGRIMLVLWAASIATSTAIAAAGTFAAVGLMPVSVVNDAPQIATLQPGAAVSVPVGFNGAGASSLAYEFHGLTLFETSWDGFGGGGGDCFSAVLTSDLPEEENVQGGYSMSGPSYVGCRVGNFPATITIAVNSSSPPQLRTRYPDGALQFIEDGDLIGVFLGATAGCAADCTPAAFAVPPL